MDGDVVFIEGPIDLELFGPLVRATVRTGARHYVFVATMHDFLESFARAGKLAREWRGGACEVRTLEH